MHIEAVGNTEEEAKKALRMKQASIDKENSPHPILWDSDRIYGNCELGYKMVKEYSLKT
jgi:hypothetical protein